MNKPLLLLAASLAAAQNPPDAVFQSGTRLVQVDVIVRSQRVRPASLGGWLAWVLDSGPPWGPAGEPLRGLAIEDFTLLDNGRPQPIAVFNAGPRNQAEPMTLPPGAVSNRTGDRGQDINGAAVVLVDFLNTPWIESEYLRVGVKNLLRDLKPDDRVSIYTLGKKLHVIQNLAGAGAGADADVKAALQDYGNPPTPFVDPRENPAITLDALTTIARHLSGVRGRKNLVWVGGHPSNATIAALQQADIVVYPVKVRSAGMIDTAMPSGGRMFLDAMDLTNAVHAAEEDEGTAYVLGFYPAEDTLDGKYHTITVTLKDPELRKKNPEVHNRAGYRATRVAVLPPAPSLAGAFNGPLNATAIGLAAQATPQAPRANAYDLHVTVDLRDIHFDRQDGRFIGAFDYAIPNPSVKGTLKVGSVDLSLSDQQFTEGLDGGFTLIVKGVEADSGELRIVVRDRAAGVAGSLPIPVPQ